uniref:Uncharacterized protein n=1 Tax=Oxyrrhis marina TaxID=2969 RepID=A0A7S4GN88_OXYMA
MRVIAPLLLLAAAAVEAQPDEKASFVQTEGDSEGDVQDTADAELSAEDQGVADRLLDMTDDEIREAFKSGQVAPKTVSDEAEDVDALMQQDGDEDLDGDDGSFLQGDGDEDLDGDDGSFLQEDPAQEDNADTGDDDLASDDDDALMQEDPEEEDDVEDTGDDELASDEGDDDDDAVMTSRPMTRMLTWTPRLTPTRLMTMMMRSSSRTRRTTTRLMMRVMIRRRTTTML